MALNTHYSGRLVKAVKRTVEKAAGRSGKFYEIFNRHGFFDVNDENNGLTKEQREQVPVQNQTRFTQFSNALAEMFAFVLGDENYGLLTNDTQNILDMLDIRSSANASQIGAVGNGLQSMNWLPVIGTQLSGIDGTRRVMEAQTIASMGSSPFNPDLVPPIAIGLDGIPPGVANVYKPGFFQPNFDFLYKLEPIKSAKFYTTGDGKLRIGANIVLSGGGNKQDLYLKNIFSVVSTDKNLNPVGDVKGGVTSDQYEIIKLAASSNSSVIDPNSPSYNANIADFRLTDAQIQSSYFKYVDTKLWSPITNRQNWAHGHWGALTNNACPEYVKTAVCSYLWTNGLAIESNKSDISAFISYCLTLGMYYLTGYQYNVKMYGISGFDKILDANKNKVDASGELIAQYGLPKDTNKANRYFTWIADFLVRVTSNTNGEEVGKAIRERRVAEANLIYKGVGLPTITFGDSLTQLPYEHTEAGLKDRLFDKIVAARIYRYDNKGTPGGANSDGSLSKPENSSTKISYGAEANAESLSDISVNVIKYLCESAGVTSAYITSTYRAPQDQVRAMFNNLQANKTRDLYGSKTPAPSGSRGRAVVNRYYTEKRALGFSDSQPVTGEDNIAKVKAAMLDQINKEGAETISKHSSDYNIIQAVDVSPKLLEPKNKAAVFEAVCNQAVKDGILRAFLIPKKDPAYHMEIWQPASRNGQPFTGGAVNNVLPDKQFVLNNPNYSKSSSWIAPLSKDHIYAQAKTASDADQS